MDRKFVLITLHGDAVYGNVISAVNYRIGAEERDNWYIELHNRMSDPVYLKQVLDGYGDAVITFFETEEELKAAVDAFEERHSMRYSPFMTSSDGGLASCWNSPDES